MKSSFGRYNQISKVALQQCTVRWSSTDTKEGSTDKVDTKESSAKTEPEVDDLGDVIPPEISSAEKILSLEKEIRDLKDRVVRSFAEEENVRLCQHAPHRHVHLLICVLQTFMLMIPT